MSDKPVTHKGRNIIDDILDGTLLVLSILYLALAPKFGIELDDQTMAAIATAGAALRVTVRKILMKLYGERLGVSEGAEDVPPKEVASDASGSED